MEKEYKIKFTANYLQYEEWANEGDSYFQNVIDNNSDQLEICKKWSGKKIKLSEIPEFIKEVGECVISEDEIEIYNGYRE